MTARGRSNPHPRQRYPGAGSSCRLWLLAILLLACLPAHSAYGATSPTDLGKLTDDVSSNPYLPLGDYVRAGKVRHLRGLPELLFIGTQLENSSAAEEWSVIKALDQFGTFSHVRPLDGFCSELPSGRACNNAGFDLDHARYRSKYIVFTYRDLENRAGKCHAPLPANEMALVWANGIKFYRPKPTSRCKLLVSDPRTPFPLTSVGGYFQRNAGLAGSVDFETFLTPPPGHQVISGPENGLPFTTVQAALVRGVDQPGSTLVRDVNAEANIIVALICHADHRRPAKACGRAVITRLLKHVK